VEIARAKKILGAKRVVDSSKTLMNAAVLRSSELLRRLCAKLLSALKSLDLPQDETLSRLEAQATALIEDTSWLLSDELKEKRYVRWGEHADELLSYVLALLARIDAEAADDSAVRELKVNYVRKLSKLLAKHLGDEALEKQLKVKTEAKKNGGSKKTAKSRPTGKKDKLVSDVDSEARHAADHKRKVKAGYKTHVTMDCDSEIVTAVIVTPMNCDDGPVLPALIADELRRGLKIEEVAADAAYADGPVREALAKEKISTYIPDPAPKPSAQGKYISKDFRFDPAAMTLTCPGNRVSSTATPKGDSYLFYFSREGCAACPLKAACLSQREIASGVKHGRTVSVTRFRPLHEAARAAHESAGHKDAMNRRLAVEHKQAEMLNQRGLRNARYRGLMKTSTQGYLTAFATNIRRMAVLALSAEKVGETAAKPA
jgi:IS5 family transposase